MQPIHVDLFTRSSAALNTTSYPTIFGNADSAHTTAVKFEPAHNASGSAAGKRWGFDLKVPNYAVDIEGIIDSTDSRCCALIVCARYNSSDGSHYGFALGNLAGFYPKSDGTDSTHAIAADKAYLVKSTGTTVTSLATAVDYTVANNTTYRMRILVNGSLIQGYVNDKLVISATDTTYPYPYVPAFGYKRTTTAAGTPLAYFDNLIVTPCEFYMNAQTAYDEASGLIYFSLPSTGSVGMQQVFVLHEKTGDWTKMDLATTCLFSMVGDDKRRKVLYGSPSDGKLWQLDTTATRDGASFTGTWKSNWVQIDPERKRRAVVQYVKYLTELATANQFEATVEVADDPDDPTVFSRQHLVSGYCANERFHVGQRGNFVRVSISNNNSSSTLKLRGIEMEVLS